jgi:hypothetical protein
LRTWHIGACNYTDDDIDIFIKSFIFTIWNIFTRHNVFPLCDVFTLDDIFVFHDIFILFDIFHLCDIRTLHDVFIHIIIILINMSIKIIREHEPICRIDRRLAHILETISEER